MSKSSHEGTGDLPQNQNNAMSDDPADGNRNSFTAEEQSGEAPARPRHSEEDKLREFGERGSKQP
ncbi:hypothetical protein [Sphingomonas sp. LHG3443-2]|uniref:hypothetical protein n=1 Tax=Sphingomonas sp. LHG3443-2 TaxID=2804639 RepID=UPI003CF05CB0